MAEGEREGVDRAPAPLLLTDAQVRRRLDMATCVEAVEEAYARAGAGDVDTGTRGVVASAGGARLLTVAVASSGLRCLVSLAYSGRPVGADRKAAAFGQVEKVITVFDTDTGACKAVIGGNYLLWLYTGAMGAVAIKHLAPPDAATLALVGSGRQARAALEGARAVMPLAGVRVWSRRFEHAQRFAHAQGGQDLPVVPCPSIGEAVAGADVVVTVTTASEPVVSAAELPEGCHINAIGAHYPERREVGPDVVAGSTVFVDTIAQARAEKGELILAEREGAFDFADVADELGAVVARGGQRPRGDAERTLFCSSGSGIELLGAAVAALRTADPRNSTTLRLN